MTTLEARRLLALVLLATAAFSGCAAKSPTPRYFKVEREPEPTRAPAVVRVPEPMPLPQLRPIPLRRRGEWKPAPKPCLTDPDAGEDLDGGEKDRRRMTAAERKRAERNEQNCNETIALLAEARQEASQGPERDGYFNSIQTFNYEPGALFHIYAAPLRVTTITLQPGEQVMGNAGRPTMGDSVRWQVSLGRSLAGKQEQQHLFLRPTRAWLDTSITIITNRRTYIIEAHALPSDYMAAVSWRYPQDEIAELEQAATQAEAREKIVTSSLDLSSANFRYDIKVLAGKPRWTPEQVFDDGRKTFIKFPKSMMFQVSPVFFVMGKGDESLIVNYRVKNEYFVVDRLFDVGELRIEQEKQDIVRISRK